MIMVSFQNDDIVGAQVIHNRMYGPNFASELTTLSVISTFCITVNMYFISAQQIKVYGLMIIDSITKTF